MNDTLESPADPSQQLCDLGHGQQLALFLAADGLRAGASRPRFWLCPYSQRHGLETSYPFNYAC